ALVNPLTAALTFASLIGYAVVYTGFLKRATPQNIVIGGIAGAAPPLLGWAAVTNMQGQWDWAHALLLVLIIFVWTPPHFCALADPALHRAAVRGDGAAGGDRHERPVLPRWRGGAGPGLPLVRLAPARSAGRTVRDEGLQLLGGLPDGAVRLPAGRPLAAAVAGSGAAAGIPAGARGLRR